MIKLTQKKKGGLKILFTIFIHSVQWLLKWHLQKLYIT